MPNVGNRHWHAGTVTPHAFVDGRRCVIASTTKLFPMTAGVLVVRSELGSDPIGGPLGPHFARYGVVVGSFIASRRSVSGLVGRQGGRHEVKVVTVSGGR